MGVKQILKKPAAHFGHGLLEPCLYFPFCLQRGQSVSHGLLKLGINDWFLNVIRGTDAQSFLRPLKIRVGAYEHDLYARLHFQYLARQLQPGHMRHADVAHDQIHIFVRPHILQDILTAAKGAHQFRVQRGKIQIAFKALDGQRVIVRDDNPKHEAFPFHAHSI